MKVKINITIDSSLTHNELADHSIEYAKFLDEQIKSLYNVNYAYHYESTEFGNIDINFGIVKHMTSSFSCILYTLFEVDDSLNDADIYHKLNKDTNLVTIIHDKLNNIINELNNAVSKIVYPSDRKFTYNSKLNQILIGINPLTIENIEYEPIQFYDTIINDDIAKTYALV